MQQRNDVTRISELPEHGFGSSTNGSMNGLMANPQYQPLNVHSNPYGIPEPTDRQLPSIKVGDKSRMPSMGGGMGGFQGQGIPMPNPEMHSRDVPIDTTMYQQDEQSIPTHVPSQKLTIDYLREYETKLAEMTAEHKKEKHQTAMITSLYDEIQIPILIGVLFFMFQLPFINGLLFKYLGTMGLYGEDGNMNFNGIVFKSFLFGLCYFGFIRLSNYLS